MPPGVGDGGVDSIGLALRLRNRAYKKSEVKTDSPRPPRLLVGLRGAFGDSLARWPASSGAVLFRGRSLPVGCLPCVPSRI